MRIPSFPPPKPPGRGSRISLKSVLEGVFFRGNFRIISDLKLPVAEALHISGLLSAYRITTIHVCEHLSAPSAKNILGDRHSQETNISTNSLDGVLYLFSDHGRRIVPPADHYLAGDDLFLAAANFERALKLRLETKFLYREALSAFLNSKEIDANVEALERLRQAFPNDNYYTEQLAEIYKKAGCVDLAKPLYEQLLALEAKSSDKSNKKDNLIKDLKRTVRLLTREKEAEENAVRTAVEKKWQAAKQGKFAGMRDIMYLPIGFDFIKRKLDFPDTDYDLVALFRLAGEESEPKNNAGLALQLKALKKLFLRISSHEIRDPGVTTFLERLAQEDLYCPILTDSSIKQILEGKIKNSQLWAEFIKENYDAHFKAAITHGIGSRFEEAIMEFEKALEVFPSSINSRTNLSITWGRLGFEYLKHSANKPEEFSLALEYAENCFKKALHIDPLNVEALSWSCIVWVLKKDFRALEETCRRILTILNSGSLSDHPCFNDADTTKLRKASEDNLLLAVRERSKTDPGQ